MTAEQQDLYKRRMGPWPDLRGPFNAFMRNPALADKAMALGAHIRTANSLPEALVELAILVTGRHWTAQFEWWAHYKRAKAAGLPMHIADAIAVNQRPSGMSREEEMVYDFSTELHRTQQVADATWMRARSLFSEAQLMDLIATLGYYVMVSMILNVARATIPGGEPPPLK